MKIIKIVSVSIVMMLLSSTFSLSHGRNLWYSEGRRGNVEIEAGSTLSRTFAASILTSHGYSNGNGWYFGAGTGIFANPYDCGFFALPIFADMKYSFNDSNSSPFLAMKLGSLFYMEDLTAGVLLRPSVGVDIKSTSISIGYGFYTGIEAIGNIEYIDFTKHSFMVSVAWWF